MIEKKDLIICLDDLLVSWGGEVVNFKGMGVGMEGRTADLIYSSRFFLTTHVNRHCLTDCLYSSSNERQRMHGRGEASMHGHILVQLCS